MTPSPDSRSGAFDKWYDKYAHWDSKEEAFEAFIAAERAALELAAQYVSQHDNLGDIAADEIRALLPAGESQEPKR